MKNIYIYDKQNNFREGLKYLLELTSSNRNRIYKTFDNLQYDFSSQELPDLIIIDPNHFDDYKEHLDTINDLGIPIALMSMHVPIKVIQQCSHFNIIGFLDKSMNTNELIKAIELMLFGKVYIHFSIAENILRDYQKLKNS